MSLGGWITMTLVLLGIWGGFLYLLFQTIRQNRP